MPRSLDKPKRLGTPGAADYLDLKTRTLEDWRFRDKGPAFYRHGGRIFYLELISTPG